MLGVIKKLLWLLAIFIYCRVVYIRESKYYRVGSMTLMMTLFLGASVGLITFILTNKPRLLRQKYAVPAVITPGSHNYPPAVPGRISPNTTFYFNLSANITVISPSIEFKYPTISQTTKKEIIVSQNIANPIYIALNLKSTQMAHLTVDSGVNNKYTFQFLPSDIIGIEKSQHQVITGFFVYSGVPGESERIHLYLSTASANQFYEPKWGVIKPPIIHTRQYINLNYSIDFGSSIFHWVVLTNWDFIYIDKDGNKHKNVINMSKGHNFANMEITTTKEWPIPKLLVFDNKNINDADLDNKIKRYSGLVTNSEITDGSYVQKVNIYCPYYWWKIPLLASEGLDTYPWNYWNFAFLLDKTIVHGFMYLDLKFDSSNPHIVYKLRITKTSGEEKSEPWSYYYQCILTEEPLAKLQDFF